MEIKSSNDGKILKLYFCGRVDSTNASEAETLADKICNEETYENIVLDFDDLEYISSAGLRIILKLKKASPDIKIINANNEVFEILEMTGFAEIIPVQKAYKKVSVKGCECVGRGAKGAVYRLNGDTVVKVYFSSDSLAAIKNEHRLAKKAFVLGIPTAISFDVVMADGKLGSMFELLDAKSFSQIVRENPACAEDYANQMADLLKTIHETIVGKDDMPDANDYARKWLSADEPYFTDEVNRKLKKLVDETPDTLNMLHMDFHSNNIMLQKGEALLIDMDTLSHGYKIFELANVYITYVAFGVVEPKIVENFVGLDYETAKKMWYHFIRRYLGTEDEETVSDVENKVELMALARLLRHTVKRDTTSDEAKKTIAYVQERVPYLLGKVDSLEF